MLDVKLQVNHKTREFICIEKWENIWIPEHWKAEDVKVIEQTTAFNDFFEVQVQYTELIIGSVKKGRNWIKQVIKRRK
jgi:hypothetical protein